MIAQQWAIIISIHALREEGDVNEDGEAVIENISIHALREEGDAVQLTGAGGQVDFYPRPPRGGRRENLYEIFIANKFLSTPSARRATRTSGERIP